MFYFAAICLAIWLALTIYGWRRKRTALQKWRDLNEVDTEQAATLRHVCLSSQPTSVTTLNHEKISFEAHRVADLIVTSGRLLAVDGLGASDQKPFLVRTPTGKFPVILTLAQASEEIRPAFAAIEFSRKRPILWEAAIPEGLSSLAKITGFTEGFPVDSWHAAFLDADAAPTWSAGPPMSLATEHTANDGLWNQHEFPGTRANMVTFLSGFGSGYYSCYFGRDSQGKIVCLVADFRFLANLAMYREIKARSARNQSE